MYINIIKNNNIINVINETKETKIIRINSLIVNNTFCIFLHSGVIIFLVLVVMILSEGNRG